MHEFYCFPLYCSLQIFVVMERMKGDMLVMILSSPDGRLNERVTKYVIYQVCLSASSYFVFLFNTYIYIMYICLYSI